MEALVWSGLVPANVQAIAPYEPGKPIEALERELGIVGAIKLASNENPLGPSPKAVAAAQSAACDVGRYPDGSGHELRDALATHLGVAKDELALGAGSNDLIDLLVRTFCRPDDEVLSHRFAFVMYKISCQAHGVTYREAPVRSDLGCDVEALAAAITPRTKLIFLPNPNNPTGAMIARGDFERFLARVPRHVILAVDEAYQEYAVENPDYPIAERHRASHPLIVTLRTFSKIYGLAGLRVGYAIADRKVVDYLNRVRLPFNVSTPAQEGACAALSDAEHVLRSQRVNASGLVQLRVGLGDLGLHVYASAANFVMVELSDPAQPVYQSLLQKGIIVRPLLPSGLDRHLRISVGTAAENERAITAFREVLA